MPSKDTPPEETSELTVLVEYICERCGFHYNKGFDFAPFLCYRCMRFVAKRVFVTMNTITPPISRPEREDI